MSGKVGTYVGGESNVGRFVQNIEAFEWAGAWVPKGKELYSEGTSTAFCMNGNTKVQDAAWEFIKFLTGDVRAYAEMGPRAKLGVPPHREAFEQLFLGTEPRSDVKAILGDMVEYNRVWMLGVTAGAEVKTAVDQGLSRVWSGDQTAKDACSELAGKLKEILANQPR
jgi:ABC-type glycerol-3-phosphate transport system substrate-binding protein